MNCEETRELLDAFHDGELQPADLGAEECGQEAIHAARLPRPAFKDRIRWPRIAAVVRLRSVSVAEERAGLPRSG